jgi:5-methyltetrahydrofolate--homocysteine methyltransferase
MSYEQLMTAVIEGDSGQAQLACQQMLDEGLSAKEILDGGLVPAMEQVGRGMETGEYFLGEVIMAADTFHRAMEVLKPSFENEAPDKLGTAVIGTIAGDIHDVGKNLVATMWETAGFEVHDLGIDVHAERFVEAVREHSPQLVGVSAEITTTMLGMSDVIQALEEAGVRDHVKVMVGGPPLSLEYAKSIGADGYGVDCFDAIVQAKALLGQSGAQS